MCNLPELLRAAIRADGRTQAKLAEAAKMPQGNLSRFLSGGCDMNLTVAGPLMAALGLEVRKKKSTASK